MSGSDASTRTTGGTGGGHDACPIQFETILGSPDPDVIDDLEVGDLLDVRSIDEPVRGVIFVTLDGSRAGALTREIATMRRCLSEGVPYEAEVLRVLGGSVNVLVRQI